MNTAAAIEKLRQFYSADRFHFEFNCSMLIAGPANKKLRQAIVKELTGEDLPASKTGLHFVSDILKAKFEQLTLF
jgi:hypothetical protein